MTETIATFLSITFLWAVHALYLWAKLQEAREEKDFWEWYYNMADSNHAHECNAHNVTKKTLRELKQTLAATLQESCK